MPCVMQPTSMGRSTLVQAVQEVAELESGLLS